MSNTFRSTHTHCLSEAEVKSIVDAIHEARDFNSVQCHNPKSSCKMSPQDVEKWVQRGNEAYEALDWTSLFHRFGEAMTGGVDWIVLIPARFWLAAFDADDVTVKLEELLPLVLDLVHKSPGESATYLVVALIKSHQRLFSQASQWLDFCSLTNKCPPNVYQHVSDTIQFRMKSYRADIDDVLPHLLKPSRLLDLKRESYGINFEIVEPILEKLRSDHSYIEQIWENDSFVSLIALAKSKYNHHKWYLYLDEEVTPQCSELSKVDDRAFLKIIWYIGWLDLMHLSLTCKMMSNRCKNDDARLVRESVEVLDENSTVPIYIKEREIVIHLINSLVALPIHPEEGPKIERLVLLGRHYDLIDKSPLMCPPVRLACEWILGILSKVMFNTKCLKMLCWVATNPKLRSEGRKMLLQMTDIPVLCEALTDSSEYGCLPGLLFTLIEFGNLIDFENSKVGCYLPDDPSLSNSKFSPGVWHIIIAHLSNPFDDHPEFGVMHLCRPATSPDPELEVLIGKLVTTSATYVVVIRLNESDPKMVAKSVGNSSTGGGFDLKSCCDLLYGLSPLSLLDSDGDDGTIVFEYCQEHYAFGGTCGKSTRTGNSSTACWMAYRDTRPFEEAWYQPVVNHIRSQSFRSDSKKLKIESEMQSCVEARRWIRILIGVIQILSKEYLCSATEMEQCDRILSKHPGKRGESINRCGAERAPFEKDEPYDIRVKMLSMCIHFIFQWRTRLFKPFLAESERILSAPESSISDSEMHAWRKLLFISPSANPLEKRDVVLHLLKRLSDSPHVGGAAPIHARRNLSPRS